MLLTTERLLIKEITAADAAFYLKLLNSPGFIQNIGDRNIDSIAAAESYIVNNVLFSYNLNGFGLYKMIKKHTDEFIGTCGFVKRDYLDKPDFGYSILPEFERKGYTLEAAKAILVYGCNKWNLRTVLAITRPNNIASCRLLEKLSFTAVSNTIDPVNNEALIVYEYKHIRK